MVGALIMAIVFPIAAMIIQLAISRSREYGADATGAQIAGSPDGLANALLKLESAAQRIPMQVNPSTSHLFIVNPLSGASMARLFSTHRRHHYNVVFAVTGNVHKLPPLYLLSCIDCFSLQNVPYKKKRGCRPSCLLISSLGGSNHQYSDTPKCSKILLMGFT